MTFRPQFLLCYPTPPLTNNSRPAPKSSTSARFRGLWAFSGPHRCRLSTTTHKIGFSAHYPSTESSRSFSMCGLPLITTKYQPPSTTTENKCSRSFPVVVCFLSGRCHYHPHQLAPTTSSSRVILFEVYCEIYLEIQVSGFLSFFEFREVFSGLVNLKNHFDTFLMPLSREKIPCQICSHCCHKLTLKEH